MGFLHPRPCLIIQQQENTGAKEQRKFRRFLLDFSGKRFKLNEIQKEERAA